MHSITKLHGICNIFLFFNLFLSQCLKQLQAPLRKQHLEGLRSQMQTTLQLQAYLQKSPAGKRLCLPRRQEKGLLQAEKNKKKNNRILHSLLTFQTL